MSVLQLEFLMSLYMGVGSIGFGDVVQEALNLQLLLPGPR